MITQLQSPLTLSTPQGKASAVAVIDGGPHSDLLWIAFVHDSGECVTFSNSEIRQEKLAGSNVPASLHSQRVH